MQDRSPPARRNHLQRAAGPYIGSNATESDLPGHFRWAPNNGHRQINLACLKRAKLGSRHDATSSFKLVERAILLV